MAVPTANILHQETIRRLSGDGAFERGRSYFHRGRVSDLQRKDGAVLATVRGSDTYQVRIWTKDDSLAYSCSCPQGQSQAFCKHAVAVALASVGDMTASPSPSPSPSPSFAPPPSPSPPPSAPPSPPVSPPAPGSPPAGPLLPPTKARPVAPPVLDPGAVGLGKGGIVETLRGLSREELLMVVLEAALEDDAFRNRLIERLRDR